MGLIDWYTRSGFDPGARAPREVIALRTVGVGMLVVCVGVGVLGDPPAGLEGEGLAISALTAAFAVLAVALVRSRRPLTEGRRAALLVPITLVAATLVQLQPSGLWNATPYFIASVTAMLSPGRRSVLAFALSTIVVLGSGVAAGRGDAAGGILLGVVPWFLFMRVMRRVRDEHEVTKGLLRELEASRAAEAAAAAENERARVARDLHDVLAHSLSSLALQLESTRLLARKRGVDPEVTDAIGRSHGIAAGGLEEARRAIGALRGEDLPGPDRLPALVDAFRAETGVPARLRVEGEPRPLPADARLAVFRTAQEALTNVRKHAPHAAGVDVRVVWGPQRLCLVVDDRAPACPPGPGGGYGLQGMRERAELVGGALRAGTTDDGFRVRLELPAPVVAARQPGPGPRAGAGGPA